jgi:hypothetical protein
MPSHPGARLDGVRSAIASLTHEERRLEQLGFDDALQRVRRERRYWEFLEALFSLPAPCPRLRGALGSWPEGRGR